MRTRLLFLLPIVAFGGLAAAFLIGLQPGRDPHLIPSPLINKPAPEFTLPSLFDGEAAFSRSDLVGQVHVVNLFASWCVPCRAEHPVLQQLAASGGVPIVGINYKDRKEDAEGWLAELGNPFSRILADTDGKVAIDWGVYGVPETFIVDSQGQIRLKITGPLTEQSLKHDVLPMIRKLRG